MTTPDNPIPADLLPTFTAIVQLTDQVCDKALNDDYRKLCREVSKRLCDEDPCPLRKGKPASWACGIAFALGQINFLYDPSQTPHVTQQELCRLFGVGYSTGAAKAREVREVLDTFQMDPRWSLPSMLERNPLAWMIEVNGLPVDARYVRREIQEIAFEKGLIPFIPGDNVRRDGSED